MHEITPDEEDEPFHQQLKRKATEHAHKIKGHIKNIHGQIKQKLQETNLDDNDLESASQNSEDLEYNNFDNFDNLDN